MTTKQSWRRERARQTEALVAEWFAGHGWPDAEPVGPYQAGTDIRKMPGLYVSVKACAEDRPRPWLRDATAAAGGDLAIVVTRPDGMGPATVDIWPCYVAPGFPWTGYTDGPTLVTTLRGVTADLHKAGYGNAG